MLFCHWKSTILAVLRCLLQFWHCLLLLIIGIPVCLTRWKYSHPLIVGYLYQEKKPACDSNSDFDWWHRTNSQDSYQTLQIKDTYFNVWENSWLVFKIPDPPLLLISSSRHWDLHWLPSNLAHRNTISSGHSPVSLFQSEKFFIFKPDSILEGLHSHALFVLCLTYLCLSQALDVVVLVSESS